tara:strand:- start:523 stop:828 length:306 start_codon:yes stop_codon:yes gene_type:complete
LENDGVESEFKMNFKDKDYVSGSFENDQGNINILLESGFKSLGNNFNYFRANLHPKGSEEILNVAGGVNNETLYLRMGPKFFSDSPNSTGNVHQNVFKMVE